MRAHGRKPFPCIENIPVVTTLRHMDDNSLIIETLYPLFVLGKDTRKRAGRVAQGRFFFRQCEFPAEDRGAVMESS